MGVGSIGVLVAQRVCQKSARSGPARTGQEAAFTKIKINRSRSRSSKRSSTSNKHLLRSGAGAVEVQAVGVRDDLVLEAVENEGGAGGGRHLLLLQ